jgi:hypothetical protein
MRRRAVCDLTNRASSAADNRSIDIFLRQTVIVEAPGICLVADLYVVPKRGHIRVLTPGAAV